ncbi:MAG: hypothetical protein ACK5MO_08905, partial [Planctomyces sp.]
AIFWPAVVAISRNMMEPGDGDDRTGSSIAFLDDSGPTGTKNSGESFAMGLEKLSVVSWQLAVVGCDAGRSDLAGSR